MKYSFLKKTIFVLLLSFLHFYSTEASVLGPNIKVKLNGASDSTYTTSISNVGNDSTLIDLEIVGVFSSTSTGSYSISFPSGFEYVSNSTTGTTCDNQNITLTSDTGFSYTVNPTNQTCVSRFVLSYRVGSGTSAGSHQINVFDAINFNNTSSLTISVLNVVDGTSPEGSSVTYNGETATGIVIEGNSGANDYSNVSNGTVNLSIAGSDNSGSVSEMCVSESALTTDNTCSSRQSYSTSGSHTFSTEGSKTLYIKFKDPTGNISPVYSDSIIWDITGPSASSDPDEGTFANGSQTITLSCSDTHAGCSTIYYTTDGSTPNALSSTISSGNTITLSGTNETKNLQFFSTDAASNDGSIVSKNYGFEDSYVTITTPTSPTNLGTVTFTGTCNNASGNNTVEYALNGGSYTSVTTDNCESSNSWSSNITLSTNTTNSLMVRLINNTNVTSTTSIVHDDTSPSGSIVINSGDSSTTSTSVTLTLSATDSVGVSNMCISEDVLTNDSNCGKTWQSYTTSNVFNLSSSLGTKTVYAKFQDTAGNISSVVTDTITLASNKASTPSSGGGGGGPSKSTKKYESYKNTTKKKVNLTETQQKNITAYTVLDISALENQNITGKDATIRINSNLKSKSYLTIEPDTKILSGADSIYPPQYYEPIRDLKKRTMKINGTDFRASNIKRLFQVGDENKSIVFDKEVGLELNLGENIESVYVYFGESIDDSFELIKTNLKTNEDGIIEFKTKKLGYFAVVKSIYVATQTFDVYKSIEEGKDSKEEYIEMVEQDGIVVYKTKYSKLAAKVEPVEKLLLGKFKRLFSAGKISEDTYQGAIESYNEFIFHVSIYKMTKQKEAISKALEAGRKFIRVYKI